MSGSYYIRSTDPEVRAVGDFLAEQYGSELERPFASWDADARQLLFLLAQRRSERGPLVVVY